MAYTISNNPLSEKDFLFIQDQLVKYATGASIVNISEMDGFFTSVVSCANVIPFDNWYPAFWGGAEHLPKWKSDVEFQRFFDLLVQHMNQIAMMLIDYPEEYSPIFNLADDDQTLEVEDWCYGYERGVGLDPIWETLPEQEQMMHALITLDRDDPDNPLAQEDPVQLVRFAAVGLHTYWMSQSAEGEGIAEPARVEHKAGRNDPCPCGSGKKYKQCCLG